ncbi:hypothetical protein R1sor_012341 [Riccia sorocarpa]|uniref:DUF7869 domain-containing protein n=1 Tax=Riccia sorocarpa TaxID=122646 RepID=A0ABD3I3I2_9MARC
MASTSAEVKRLSPGENILLYGDNFIVGVGSVHSVDESELCHANVEVTLLSIVESLPIADGIIFLPFSTSCVGEVRVEEQYAGVLVSTVHSEVDPTILDKDLPNFHPDDPITLRWPILHLRIASSGAILGNLYKVFEDAGTRGPQTGDEDMPVNKKRAYNNVKRTKPNPEVLLQRRLYQKKMSMCTPDKITECLRFTCTCSRECMRKVDKKDIIDERSFFYNEPYTRRVEYILSKFDHPGFEEGYMLFRTLEVCKKTFYTLYGFVKQTFYNYKKAYTMGQRVGFHGNSGTFKPKDTTIFARACMKSFFQQTAEPLPHKESRNENTDGIIYRLPKALSRDDVYREILGKMEAVGMTAISRVAFDNLWKKEFPNYGMHNSSAFAKCLLCVKFTTMLQRERRSAERAKLELDREKHLKHQMSGRTVYYSHRELSTSSPSLYLSFIHDAMDLAKTIIPRLCDKVKTLMGSVQPLPLKVIGINHGHEPGVVAHVTVGGLWKSDPNYTITSIAKQLRDYENFHTDKKLGDLHFTDQTSHPLFNALMDEEVFNTTVLAKKRQSKEEFFQMEGADNSELQASTRMLPPNLYIQLDNSAKDNKNWAMMAFCSELVARGCCKMITMSFLVVGHTHEDVDAFFSKVNAAQAGKDIESLPHFLAVVYHAQSSKAYPRVIQEVADYKEHVKDYMEKITGQSAPVAIRFYMRDNIPVYQVQENYGGEWVPPYGRTVWKRCEPESETNFQVVLPPRQDPVAKGLMCPHAKKVEILGYIRNYITYKKEMQLKADPTSSHYWEDNALIQYWTNVSDVFQAGWPSEENQPLQESFWPSTNHGTGYSLGGPSTENLALVLHHGEAQEELRARDEIFVGAASARKFANFVPMIDIANGLMLLIRPSDDFECQDCLWVGKATGAVCQVGADTNFNKVPIQWWRPKHASSKASISDRYSQCIQRNVAWEVDPAYSGSHWIMADACVYAWKSRATKDKSVYLRQCKK